MAKGKLSERQEEMIEFIGTFSRAKGYPPTIRQIGEAVNISSTSVVNYNLNKLERDGYILRDLKVSRGVRLADGVGRRALRADQRITIPLAGFIFATLNMDALPLTEHLGPIAKIIDEWLDRNPGGRDGRDRK